MCSACTAGRRCSILRCTRGPGQQMRMMPLSGGAGWVVFGRRTGGRVTGDSGSTTSSSSSSSRQCHWRSSRRQPFGGANQFQPRHTHTHKALALASCCSGMPTPLPPCTGRAGWPHPSYSTRAPSTCCHVLPQAGDAAWSPEVDDDCGAPARPHWQAVPRAVSARRPAPPPQRTHCLTRMCLPLAACCPTWLGTCRTHPLHALPRRRWHNHLNPNIKRGQWSRQEDEVIVRFHRRFGNQVRRGGGCPTDLHINLCVTNWEAGAGRTSPSVAASPLTPAHAAPLPPRPLSLCVCAVGAHGSAPQGPHRQCHQEPLELHPAPQGGCLVGWHRSTLHHALLQSPRQHGCSHAG